ncbi:hypothetical protein [Streptomyces longwoodensis]
MAGKDGEGEAQDQQCEERRGEEDDAVTAELLYRDAGVGLIG